MNDIFEHNTRSELVISTVNGKNYEYAYDNIGNREFALEDGKATMYDANSLNQYTAIAENGGAPFIPQFDADGNQTLIKTETGIWSAVYNAENRPVCFTNTESNTVVECAYDSMGRRAYKKVTVNGSVTLHQRYIYRGYLQIACSDLTRSHHPDLSYILWDPTQNVATRPLAIQLNGTWYTYGWDLTKNICELYSSSGTISTSYTYSPFGRVTSTGNVEQPIQWSSEVWDCELGLVYYNWRYYNTLAGCFISRDDKESHDYMLYRYVKNKTISKSDYIGKFTIGFDIKNLGHVGLIVNNTRWDFGRYYGYYKDTEYSDSCVFLCAHPIHYFIFSYMYNKNKFSIKNKIKEKWNFSNTGPLMIVKNKPGSYEKQITIRSSRAIDNILSDVLDSIYSSAKTITEMLEDETIKNRIIKSDNPILTSKYVGANWDVTDNCVTRAIDAMEIAFEKAMESNDPNLRMEAEKLDSYLIPFMNVHTPQGYYKFVRELPDEIIKKAK